MENSYQPPMSCAADLDLELVSAPSAVGHPHQLQLCNDADLQLLAAGVPALAACGADLCLQGA